MSERQAPYSDFSQGIQALAGRLARALDRVEQLRADRALPDDARLEAMAFHLERAAWVSLELARAWVYEARLGVPRKETDSIEILQREGWLAPEAARPLRQACELRSISSREPDRVDWGFVSEPGPALAAFRTWLDLAPRLKRP
jgi:uncharacterized protein YutE (UPF0331/DUF86 family)